MIERRRRILTAAAAWVLGVGLLLAAVWASLSATSDRLLREGAEHTALKYAGTIVSNVPELQTLFVQRRASKQTLQELRQLRALGDVFRFKLFSREGALLLVSDDLDKPDPLQSGRGSTTTLGSHQAANQMVADIVLGGDNFVEIKDGSEQANRPRLYTEAYVPVKIGAQVVGVVEVYVDATAHAARIRSAFFEVATVVGGALLLIVTASALQWWQRERDKRSDEQRMRYLAAHDALSGALNRASFGEALQQAAWRHGQGGPAFAVLCIDLDRFKDVNDTHGHAAGDAVLREATRRLQTLVRHGDSLARLGGDEFALLQGDAGGSEQVHALGLRIVQALSEPYLLDGQRVGCGASVGAARFGSDATEVADLLHKADVAMYRAKTSGRGRFSFYDSELDQQLEERRALARDLREATACDRNGPGGAPAFGLSMHYQPLHAADGSTLLGYEALMRWNHATRGAIPPAVFIPLAEDTGQIERLGRWALERACAEAATWPAPLQVSVNLSAAQFRGEYDLVDVVSAALDQSGLAPSRLMLEITESLLMSDTESVVRTLTRLSAMGVGIAMDDFGTGYSSLAYLWRFPFDKVKIDRAFTQGLADDKKVALIVRSIVSLAHSMGIRVNAEGVETERQMQMLQRMGCDELQGYLLGRPTAASTLTHSGAAEEQPAPPAASQTDFAALGA